MTDKTKKATKKAQKSPKKPDILDEQKEEQETDTSQHHIVLRETKNPSAKWYVIHTYSGHESKIAQTLIQRIKTIGVEDKIFEILIPTQDKIHIKQGQKTTVKEQLFPGYMLIKMILDDNAWITVRTTQGVTSFIGTGNKPTPLPESEVQSIQKFVTQATPKFKSTFTMGEAVKITDGPFADFLGQIDQIDEARGKVRVLVSIFGRETPVELDFLQIAKA